MKQKKVTTGLALVLGAFLAAPGCGGEASTPEICDEACRIWDACEGASDFYPYEVCLPECRAEGDWDEGYLDCLRQYSQCVQLENQCG